MSSASRSFALVLLLASTASGTPADDAFKKGRDLMKAGKYAEACAAFAESQKLDPSLGTQFNIAQCQEKTGRLASALKIYRDLAQYDTNETRKAAAATLADKLEPRVPQLLVHLDPNAAGAKIALDGVDCPTCLAGPVHVDLASIQVGVTAPGFKPITKKTDGLEEAKVVSITISLERDVVATTNATPTGAVGPTGEPTGPYAMPVNREVRRSRKKTYGMIAVAGGGAIVVTGVVFGVLARSRWQEAKDVCGGSLTCANDSDTQYAQDLGDSARTRANVSTGLVIGGAVIAGVGAYLWATAPKERTVEIGAAPSSGGGSLVLFGRF